MNISMPIRHRMFVARFSALADEHERLARFKVLLCTAALDSGGRSARSSAIQLGHRDAAQARAALVDERKREAGTLAALSAERASVVAKGPADRDGSRVHSELLGADTDSERAIRWLIALGSCVVTRSRSR
jgi:hypothetical protein